MPKPRSIESQHQAIRQDLRRAGIDSAGFEASLLIEFVTGLSRADQIVSGARVLSAEQSSDLENLVSRRVKGEPLDNIFGNREFYGLTFTVTSEVLSPRPETEMIVDFVLKNSIRDAPCRVLDLGTGSGAIPIVLLKNRDKFTAVGVDLSAGALAVAKENAKCHGVDERFELVQGSWFEPVTGVFDFIISNPPYITTASLKTLSPEVRNFDPILALDGGQDGLEAYRAILKDAADFLTPDGSILLEIGFDQGQSVPEILREAGFYAIIVHQDLARLARMVTAKLRPNSKI